MSEGTHEAAVAVTHAQLAAAPRPARLASENVVVSAPMSFSGSAARIWKLTRLTDQPGAKVPLVALSVALIATAWVLVAAWYVLFGLLLVPYRLIRRGSRKRKRQALQHREMLEAVNRDGS